MSDSDQPTTTPAAPMHPSRFKRLLTGLVAYAADHGLTAEQITDAMVEWMHGDTLPIDDLPVRKDTGA